VARLGREPRGAARDPAAERDQFHQCGRLATDDRGDWAAAWNESSSIAPDELDRNEAGTFRGP